MRIEVIGGGPAGLYFSLLMKKHDPDHEITVHELNRHDDTFGFGVVFSATTLGHFRDYDAESFDRIRESFAYWDDIDIHYRGGVVTCGGNDFCGMSRKTLLLLLQDRCRELGVVMRFETDIDSLERFAGADLVVACNGINSWIREAYRDSFRPSYDWRPNKFVWLGATRSLPAFTFDFRRNNHGIWNLHAYQYDGEMATWIVETTEAAWRSAGLDDASEEDTVAFTRDLYADLLDGGEIVTNRSLWPQLSPPSAAAASSTTTWSSWAMPRTPRTSRSAPGPSWRWRTRSRCTRSSAPTTASAPRSPPTTPTATRRSGACSTRPRCRFRGSRHVERYWHMEPMQFAFSLMSRSKAITYDNLRVRDAGFVADMERWFSNDAAERFAAPALRDKPLPPMFAPFPLRDLRLDNRVVVSPMCQYCAADGMPTEWHFVHLASRAVGGAALLFTEMACIAPDARITPGCAGIWSDDQEAAWRRLVEFVRGHSLARLCMQIGHAGRKGATKLAWEGIDQPLEEGAWEIVSASPLPYLPHSQVPREMSRADMDRTTGQFVAAVERAAACGFDMVELHAAHGYLLASFLSPVTNRRSDAYGGTLENRLRYPLEVFDACREAWPDGKPMSVRISAHDWMPGGNTPDDAVALARAFKAHGCDLVNVSSGQTASEEEPVYGRMFQTPFSEQVRIEAAVPTIVAGNIFTWDQVNTIVGAGRSDLVALARTHLYNPYFTQQAAAYYGCEEAVAWPDQYASAKFAALRQFERERETMAELREAARPDAHRARTPSLPSSKSAEWELKGARVGAAAASRG